MRTSSRLSACALALTLATAPILGQNVGPGPGTPGPAEPVVLVPPVRQRHVVDHPVPVRLTAVAARADISEQAAVTELEFTLHNEDGAPREAQLVIPVPDGVAVRSLQYDGTGPEPSATLLPRDEARRIYDSIVNRHRDPALLEFVGYHLIRTSVFPVPAGATQKVRIAYEQLLPNDAGRIDFVLPRSESLEAGEVTWTINATIRSSRAIGAVYSPSHDITTERVDANAARITLAPSAVQPGSFRLSYVPQVRPGSDVVASFALYPDPEIGGGEGGYFLMIAGAPTAMNGRHKNEFREVVLVIDRSGSMQGEKVEQAKAAALQVLEGLNPGEAFNIIDYSDTIASFSERPVVKSADTMAKARAYVSQIQANGGTNLNDALLEALRSGPSGGMLPLVLFLTDGLATVGERNEVSIRENAKKANAHQRRVFTFGVGFDVNTPLLGAVARASRGASTFVLPGEDVEVKVSQVFRRLAGPILTSPRLAGDVGGPAIIREMQPAELLDLFDGDQLVVVGQYTRAGRHLVTLEGQYLGQPRTFEFSFDTSAASARNGYVPRLWATRKIGALLEEIRAMGADGTVATSDPRMKELVDEVVRLSTKHGVLTEYTAFLATEPGAPSPAAAVPAEGAMSRAGRVLRDRAVEVRSGVGAVNQEMNLQAQVTAGCVNASNSYWNAGMERVHLTGCQLANDRTIFHRNARWIDSRLLAHESEPPEETIAFGTDAFRTLCDQLAAEGRQALLARGGEVYILVNNRRVLVKMPS